MSETEYRVRLVDSVAQISAATWNSLAPNTDGRPDNPFLEHAFFLACEESGSATRRAGWQPQHLVLEQDDGAVAGIMPLYLKSHSQGEYVFDHGWADAFQRAGGTYFPKLLSAIPFTPVTGARLLARTHGVQRQLLTAAQQITTSSNLSSVHATFIDSDGGEVAEAAGWLVRQDTQYHWHNDGFESFEQYLGTMSSRHRKATRRERRDALSGGLTVRWLTGSDLTEGVWDQFFEFYQDTGNRKWGRPYLTRSFFSLLGAAMADRVVLMFAYDGDTPIAGTFSLVGKDRLFGRYWGATREVPFLHFELCYYQAIDFAICHGLAVAEAGAQGEHKLARGYVPTTTQSVHFIAHEGLRAAVRRFLADERVVVAREQTILERYTPFRRGDASDGDDT